MNDKDLVKSRKGVAQIRMNDKDLVNGRKGVVQIPMSGKKAGDGSRVSFGSRMKQEKNEIAIAMAL